MKKTIQKLRRKQPAPPSRITNDTVHEHRQRVLAGGRKFKYPLQYSRHKLVINTIIISVGALLLMAAFGWWQLYPAQNTSEFAYRSASVLRLPVARADDEMVYYGDYLLKLRGSLYYLREKYSTQLSPEDEERQVNYLKQQSMKEVIAAAYARKLARELDLKITDEDIERALSEQKQTGAGEREITDSAYYTAIKSFYDWTPEEYLRTLRDDLLKKRVAYAIDDVAREAAEATKKAIADHKDMPWNDLVTNHLSHLAGVEYASPGPVPKTNLDGGLARTASKLEPGGISDIVMATTGNAYYIVRLISSTSTEVTYEYIRIPLTKFDRQLAQLYTDNKVTMYITLPHQEEDPTSAAE